MLTPRLGLLSFALGMALLAGSAPAAEEPACPTSPLVSAEAPAEAFTSSVIGRWYINADRTIWAGWVPAGGWPAGGTLYSGSRPVKGQKTYWVRPKGTDLAITGRRLDAEAAPVEAHIPCCYRSGFQIVGLHFPTEGCWEVNATSGDHTLRFVTYVRPAQASRR
jgi:hypothetical protein